MMNPAETFFYRPGRHSDWPAVAGLLADAGLPVADLDAVSMSRFTVATPRSLPNENLAGIIALQAFGDVGLLRSLVVARSARSAGCGSRLVHEVERIASETGVRELWLLTTEAARYFENRGFRAAARELAPLAIRETAEFSVLCPASAVLMRKSVQR